MVDIALSDRSYQILIGAGLITSDGSYACLPKAAKALIVTNATIAPLHSARLRAALDTRYQSVLELQLPDGERYKPWET